MVASALDALRDAGLAHGNVSATTVHIPDVGTAVLAAPMLGDREAGADDTVAFLHLCVHALTGQQVPTDDQGVVDYGRVLAQLVAVPGLRRRPVLSQELVQALVMPADARPTRLRRWLDHAASASAAETVTGPAATASASSISGGNSPRSANRRTRRPMVIAVGVVALAGASALTGLLAGASNGARHLAGPPLRTSTVADAVTASATWPTMPGCDVTTAVALPDTLGTRGNFGPDPRAQMIRAGGAAWQRGTLTITIRNSSGHPALLVGVDPHRVNAIIDPPAWLYRPTGTIRCPAAAGVNRLYTFDVDHWAMHSPDATPVNAQGPYLPIAAGERVTLRMGVSNCTTNVRFVVDLRLAIAGSSTGQDIILPSPTSSFTIDAVGDHTATYTGTNDTPVGDTSTSTACAGAGS